MQELAPIGFFAYNRPAHTLRALESLAANALAERSTLYVFCDGAKRRADEKAVAATRKVIRQRQWCGTVHIQEQKANRGLANSVIDSVTQLINRHGRVIVLEDDLVLSSQFLSYMNNALDVYEDAAQVMQISGYMYPITVPADLSGVFLPLVSSWGWATWSRAWKHFDPAMTGAEAVLNEPRTRRRFDVDDSHPCSQLLRLQRQQRIDSWAIRWYLSVFRANGLILFPAQSLVQNLGFDGSGIHCTRMTGYEVSLCQTSIDRFPNKVAIDERVYQELAAYFRRLKFPKPPLLQRVFRRVRHLLLRRAG